MKEIKAVGNESQQTKKRIEGKDHGTRYQLGDEDR